MKDIGIWLVYVYNGFHMASNHKTGQISGSQEDLFLKAFDEYGDALFRHAFMRISDRERAIDLVHDTYAKVWSYVRSGHEIDSFRPFLYKVLNNLIIDEYRKKKESSLDALLEADGVSEASFDGLIEDGTESLINNIDGGKAFDLLSTLPDDYREVMILKFVDGLGPKEIASLIEETENVVSVRLYRAMKALRNAIEEEENRLIGNSKNSNQDDI